MPFKHISYLGNWWIRIVDEQDESLVRAYPIMADSNSYTKEKDREIRRECCCLKIALADYFWPQFERVP
jgi:hypothetical protein